jgi:hypothetical protein
MRRDVHPSCVPTNAIKNTDHANEITLAPIRWKEERRRHCWLFKKQVKGPLTDHTDLRATLGIRRADGAFFRVKPGAAIEEVDIQRMTVRTDEGRSVAFYLKHYDRIDHGYAATIHKSQGMTVDRVHVLATPGLDAHASYLALSRHRDGLELYYRHDDFANRDRLVRTLSRDRAKDMASDYERLDPAQDYAERRGITFRARVVEIMRKLVPEKLRELVDGLLDGLRQPGDAGPGPEVRKGPEREEPRKRVPQRQAGEDPENALRRARRQALMRHARASDAILDAKRQGAAPSDEQRRALGAARHAFDQVRPRGWQDAEAADNKDNSLAREAGSGNPARAIRALQLETEIRSRRLLRRTVAKARPDQPALIPDR